MRPSRPLALSEALDLLRRSLEESPADFTEVAWVEAQNQSTRESGIAATRCTLRVRVTERGRNGCYTTGVLTREELRHAVRQALGQAAVSSPGVSSGGHPPPPSEDTVPTVAEEDLFDPALARLTPKQAEDLLRERLRDGERGTLDWTAGRVAVLRSDGLERHTGVTCAQLHIQHGEGPAAGRATVAARSLRRLDAPGVLERARRRTATDPPTSAFPATSEPGAILFEPEAAAGLLLHLGRWWRSAVDSLEPEDAAPLREARFDPTLHLEDNPLDPAALPFPFDLRGAPLESHPLLTDGRPESLSPALLDENRETHAVLHPGNLSTEEMLRLCDGGLSIGEVRGLDCLELRTLRLRCAVSGVRRIRDGRMTEEVVLNSLEVAFLPALREVVGVGEEALTLAEGDGLFGGVRAPAVALRLE